MPGKAATILLLAKVRGDVACHWLHRALGRVSASVGPTSAGRGSGAWGKSKFGFFEI
jgi:hypothetical protein